MTLKWKKKSGEHVFPFYYAGFFFYIFYLLILSESVVTLKFAPGYWEFAEVEDRIETEDYEKLAKEMERASPLEIMDKALEKFGNDIAIAFR